MAAAHILVLLRQLRQIGRGLVGHEAGRHADRTAGIGHVDHRTVVVGRDLDRRMDPAGGRPAYHQRHGALAEIGVALHF
ncbi:Uncharacterised protein [Bordetella pertussis]|nr:Uncharacterised protein [Bordetella pertussis]